MIEEIETYRVHAKQNGGKQFFNDAKNHEKLIIWSVNLVPIEIISSISLADHMSFIFNFESNCL